MLVILNAFLLTATAGAQGPPATVPPMAGAATS